MAPQEIFFVCAFVPGIAMLLVLAYKRYYIQVDQRYADLDGDQLARICAQAMASPDDQPSPILSLNRPISSREMEEIKQRFLAAHDSNRQALILPHDMTLIRFSEPQVPEPLADPTPEQLAQQGHETLSRIQQIAMED